MNGGFPLFLIPLSYKTSQCIITSTVYLIIIGKLGIVAAAPKHTLNWTMISFSKTNKHFQ